MEAVAIDPSARLSKRFDLGLGVHGTSLGSG